VAKYRAPHVDTDRAVNHQDAAIAEQFTTTPQVAAAMRRVMARTQFWLADGGF
jgi:hypothetical protein